MNIKEQMENVQNIEEMMEALEGIFSPNLRIELEIGFMDKAVEAKAEIPLMELSQDKSPREVVEGVLHEMYVGIMFRLKGQAEEELAKGMEE